MAPIDLLAIAAHPDDVELACAGTLLMARRAGKRIGIIDLTRGELSTRGTLETRARETEEASKILGLDYRFNLEMSDGNIELKQENLSLLIREIRRTRPTILLAPSKYERHPDHEAASELAHRANFYAGLAKIETKDDEGNLQEPHRPLLMLHYMQAYSFQPTVILDITPVFDERMRAIEAYSTQFGNKASNKAERETFLSQEGFFEWMRSRASAYGLQIGVRYAEPFWSPEPLGTSDLFSLVTKRIS